MASGRNVINQSIQLEGGDEVKKKLEDIGQAGEKSARQLERAFNSLNLGRDFQTAASRFQTSFANLNRAAQNFGSSISKLGQSFGAVQTAVTGTATKVRTLAFSFTAAATAVGLFVKSGLDAVDELGDTAASLGTTSQALQGYQLAAAASGIDSNTFGNALVRLNDTIKDLAGADAKDLVVWTQEVGRGFESSTINGVKFTRATSDASKAAGDITNKLSGLSGEALKAAKALLQLGVTDFKKFQAGEQSILELADAFAKFPDGAAKTQIAVDLLGTKLGPKLIPFLNLGREGIQQYRNTLEQLGLSLDDNAVKAAGNAADSISFLGGILEAFRNKFASLVAPSITQAVESILTSLKANGSGIDAFLKRTSQSFTIFIQDIIRLISGNGEPLQTEWLQSLVTGFREVQTIMTEAYENGIKPIFEFIRSTGPAVAAVINTIFGTNLSGDAALATVAIAQFLGVFTILGSVIGVVGAAWSVFTTAFALIGPVFTAAVATITFVVEALMVLGSTIGTIVGALGGLVAWVARAGVAFLASLGPAGLVITAIIAFAILVYKYWDEIKAYTEIAWTAIADFLNNLWSAISSSAASIWNSIVSGVTSAMSTVVSAVQNAYNSVLGIVSRIIAAVNSAINKAKQLIGLGGGEGEGFATGGYVSGGGTSTSDSIPAWLSNGEFVIRAAAVRKFGVSFFRALNGLNVPSSLRGGRSGFSMGGLVEGFNRSFLNAPSMATPALAAASAGMPAGKSFDLVIGNERFANLFAPEETAKNLVNFATQRKNRTLGRKPSWYGA